jgi:hypothetical protein
MRKQYLLGLSSLMLSVAATLTMVAVNPVSVDAFDGCTCEYASESYTHGACIFAACDEGEKQQCIDGNWGGCNEDCPQLAPCS